MSVAFQVRRRCCSVHGAGASGPMWREHFDRVQGRFRCLAPDLPGFGRSSGLWAPLVADPAYSDYTSGHGSATSPFAQVLRRTLGDDTTLMLKAGL